MKSQPGRGEIWLADLSPTRGHEQSGKRPVLILSSDIYNEGPSGLIVVLPITKTDRGIPIHVRIKPTEGGVKSSSVILCDAIRSISQDRLFRNWGKVSTETMSAVEDRIRILLKL